MRVLCVCEVEQVCYLFISLTEVSFGLSMDFLEAEPDGGYFCAGTLLREGAWMSQNGSERQGLAGEQQSTLQGDGRDLWPWRNGLFPLGAGARAGAPYAGSHRWAPHEGAGLCTPPVRQPSSGHGDFQKSITVSCQQPAPEYLSATCPGFVLSSGPLACWDPRA